MLSILFPCHPDQFLPLPRDTSEFRQIFKIQNVFFGSLLIRKPKTGDLVIIVMGNKFGSLINVQNICIQCFMTKIEYHDRI